MPHVLHLIRDAGRGLALEVVAEQGRDPTVTLSVVLWPGGSEPPPTLPGRVYRFASGPDDHSTHLPAVGYPELLALIFEADTVVTW